MDRRSFLKLAALGSAGLLASSYPVFIERNIVRVNRYRVPVPGLPPSFNGFTIAHLTDLHFGFLVSVDFLKGVVETTNRLGTDIIVCTGDYVHERNTAREIDTIWPVLSTLQARDGVFSVLGNHDHWADATRSLYWLERSGQNLHHRSRFIYRGTARICLGGAGDLWEDNLEIDAAFAETGEQDCNLLLSHNPDSMDTQFSTDLALILCGHTHGGQVILPFIGPPVLPVKNKRYSSGLIENNGKRTKMFIARGIGWAIYPIRFNCFPEIAVLELVRPEVG